MREKYSVFYVINIVSQSIFTLLWQIGLGIFIGFLAVEFFSAPPWIYVPFILIGVFTGLSSMIRFILAAMRSLDRLEEEKRQKRKKEDLKNGK